MDLYKERWWVYGDTGVMEEEIVTGSIYSADPRVDRDISFPSHLIIQRKYTLYLSQLLVSLALSEIPSIHIMIHAIAWIPNAGLYYIFSPDSSSP
jgi:hypothetical protein